VTYHGRLAIHVQVLESEMYNMSWGGATVYIQQKVRDACIPAAIRGSPNAMLGTIQVTDAEPFVVAAT
jgi:hypothetical protein